MKILSLTILVLSALVFTGCNNTHARYVDGEDSVTFTLEDKKRNLLGSSEDHTDWMFVAEDGKKYVPYYRMVGEFDPLGRSKLYKDLDEGTTYICEVHDILSFGPAKYPVVKDCIKSKS